MKVEISQSQRVLLCLFRIGELICLIKSIDILYEKEYYKSMVVLSFFFIYTTIILSINEIYFLNHQKKDIFQRFLWEFLYIIPHGDIEKLQSIMMNNLYAKFLLHCVQNILLQYLIIFYDEQYYWIITQLLSSILLMSTVQIFHGDKCNPIDSYLNILYSVPILNLCQGYTLLCHKSSYIYYYYIALITIGLVMVISNFLKSKQFTNYFENENLNTEKKVIYILSIYAQHFGLVLQFNPQLKREKNQKSQEIDNLYITIQSILIIILFIFDYLLNSSEQNTKFRKILQFQLLLHSYYIIQQLKWFKTFIIQGPQCRNICIDGKQTKNLNNQQIMQDYLKLKDQQKYLSIKYIDTSQDQFESLSSYLLDEGRYVEIYYGQKTRKYSNSFVPNTDKKSIYINISDKTFGQSIARLLSKHFKFDNTLNIYIRQQSNINLIYSYFVEHLELLAYIDWNWQVFNSELTIFIAEIQKIIVYNQLIKEYMIHSPAQIIYDLCDI